MSNRSLKRFPPGIEAGRPLLQDQLTLLITWFGHVLPDYSDVVRLYDFFLAGPSLVTVYPATAIVLHRQEEILAKGNISFILFLWTCTDQPFLSECKMSARPPVQDTSRPALWVSTGQWPAVVWEVSALHCGGGSTAEPGQAEGEGERERGAEPACEDVLAGSRQDYVKWRPCSNWGCGVEGLHTGVAHLALLRKVNYKNILCK